MSLIYWVSVFWGYRIIYQIFNSVKDLLEYKDKKAPKIIIMLHDMWYKINFDMKYIIGVNILNVFVICVLPHYWYGVVRGTLF